MKQSVFFLFLCLSLQLPAQLIVVQSATRQDWAGGVCCAHGTIYTATLRVTQPNRSITIDSVKFEGNTFKALEVEEGNLRIAKDDAGTTIAIQVGITHQYGNLEPYRDVPPVEVQQSQTDTQGAVIYYHSMGVPHRIRIPELTELFMIAYP